MSDISAIAYKRLRSHLGLKEVNIRIVCVTQQLADVEDDVLQAVRADVRSVFIKAHYKPGKMSDGSLCEIPETWDPVTQSDGSEVVRDSGGNIAYLRPSAGHFFEPVYCPLKNCETLADLDHRQDDIFNIGINLNLPADLNQALDEAKEFAKNVRETTDYLVAGSNFAGNIFAGAQGLGCFPPQIYRKLIKPYHQKLYSHIHKKSNVPIVMHTDESVYRLIPDIIETGVDFLNPVQASATDMDPKRLKKEFEDVLGFGEGGCDTQRILPHGKRQEIRDEVKRRIDDLAPGGGFIFSQVHNILPDVPPENIMTMYESVWEFGKY